MVPVVKYKTAIVYNRVRVRSNVSDRLVLLIALLLGARKTQLNHGPSHFESVINANLPNQSWSNVGTVVYDRKIVFESG